MGPNSHEPATPPDDWDEARPVQNTFGDEARASSLHRKSDQSALSDFAADLDLTAGTPGTGAFSGGISDVAANLDLSAGQLGTGVVSASSGTEVGAFAPGTVLADRYEIRGRLGTGGMGAVYRVYDQVQEREIALKVMLPEILTNKKAVERFNNEARLMLRLAHDGIVRVFDVGVDKDLGLRFFTMELLEGCSLRRWLKDRQESGVDPRDALEITRQLLEALCYAHKTTIHRDIKPGNVIVFAGHDLRIKLLDFGIAKLLSADRFTKTATALGTLYYMAPEQHRDASRVDGRADLFSVSVVLYEMLTGELPVGYLKKPSEMRAVLPAVLDDLVLGGLEPDPEDRPKDAHSFLRALNAIAEWLQNGAPRRVERSQPLRGGSGQPEGFADSTTPATAHRVENQIGSGAVATVDEDLPAADVPCPEKAHGSDSTALPRTPAESTLRSMTLRHQAPAGQLTIREREVRRAVVFLLLSVCLACVIVSQSLRMAARPATTPVRCSALLPSDETSVTGYAVDISGRVDDPSVGTVAANGIKEPVAQDGSFSLKVALTEGKNEIVVRAGEGERETSVTKIVHADNQPPELTITDPKPGLITNERAILVTGRVRDPRPAHVEVAGVGVPLDDGSFQVRTALAQEGENRLIVVAVDEAGNRKEEQLVVIRDTEPPVLLVAAPARDLVTQQVLQQVRGTVTDTHLDRVSLAGARARVTDGRFDLPWWLTEGANEAVLEAVDSAGNRATHRLRATLDTRAPVIKRKQPPVAATGAGWNGEAMPKGMSKATEQNVYLWDTGQGLKIEMVYVPPGDFVMGSEKYEGEKPQHHHPIPKGYYIGRYETTWKEYSFFRRKTGRSETEAPSWGAKDDHPVVNVSWDDAKAFCDWARLALPSEAQWEKAARGTDGRKYPWGSYDPIPELCRFSGSSGSHIDPVGSHPRGTSPYGAHDMAGNVWEWCADRYDAKAYERYAKGQAEPPANSQLRVLRGGGWGDVADICRCASRGMGSPWSRYNNFGFRAARGSDNTTDGPGGEGPTKGKSMATSERQRATVARAKAEAARKNALNCKARTYANKLVEKGDEARSDGDTLLSQGKPDQAATAFETALAYYTEAETEATDPAKKARVAAQVAMARTREARRRADIAKANEGAGKGSYAKALLAEKDGETAIRAKRFDPALAYFNQATGYYDQAILEANQTQRASNPYAMEAERLKQAMELAKAKCMAIDNPKQPFFNNATRYERLGNGNLVRGAYSAAQSCFKKAKDLYLRAAR
ncbi:SUMF1/EgtB/PvdO family nonheme iron enzyme [Planctomycetota bacterium]